MPLGIMIPFQAAQTAVMARAFGMNYEAGKRWVKSMTNEEFNNHMKTGFDDFDKILRITSKGVIDEFLKSLPQYDDMQKTIFQGMKEVELKKVDLNVQLLKEIPPEYLKLIFGPTASENLQGNLTGLDNLFQKITDTISQVTHPTTDPNSDPTKFNPPPKKEDQTPIQVPTTIPTTTTTSPPKKQEKKIILAFKKYSEYNPSNYSIQSSGLHPESVVKAYLVRQANVFFQRAKDSTGDSRTANTKTVSSIQAAYKAYFKKFIELL
jgi:hypothetical protein